MLKQRHSSSGLSSKTLSRSKFINRTIQQPHNMSTQSGKQGRTLRYPTKNKSCLIPRHLAQSTQSHIVCSNESNRYKTNHRNNQTFEKNLNNVENIDPNTNLNTSESHFKVHAKGNLVESKLTQPEMNFRSSTLVQPQNNKFIYKPFMSVPAQESHFKGKILSRLSDLSQNISTSQLVQNRPSLIEKNNKSPQKNKNSANLLIREKILEKQVKESFLYKNMQLSKALQEMHRFYICVNELKWICEQVHLVIKKYNQKIIGFYTELQNKQRNDLENILRESEQLLKRFNKLELTSHGGGQLFNFNLLGNHTLGTSLLVNEKEQSFVINQQKNNENYISRTSPQNEHSWSKLVENIQQNHLPAGYREISDQNRNISIGTFQVTETSSPYKNKTLNELIRLSELRKTEFMANDQDSSQKKEQNKDEKQQFNNNKGYIENRKFAKKKSEQMVRQAQLIQEAKDPFDSIHLPHFSTHPVNHQQQQTRYQASTTMPQRQKQFYEQQILRLNTMIQTANLQNSELHQVMDRRYKEVEKQCIRLRERVKKEEERFVQFERGVYRLVERALGELVKSGAVGDNSQGNKFMHSTLHNVYTKGYDLQYSNISLHQISKQSPGIILSRQSFFSMVDSLQQVFKLSQQDNKQISLRENKPANKPTDGNRRLMCFISKDKNNKNNSKNKSRQKSSSIQIQKSMQFTNSIQHQSKTALISQLNQQIDGLIRLKQQLQQQILRQERELEAVLRRSKSIANVKPSDRLQQYQKQQLYNKDSYQQLTQILLAQALTLQQIITVQLQQQTD